MPKTCCGTSYSALNKSPSKLIARKKTTSLSSRHQPPQPDLATAMIRTATQIANTTAGGGAGGTTVRGGPGGGSGAPGGGGNRPPNGQVGATAVAAPPIFALTPSLAVQGYLDYTNSYHK